MRRLDDALDCVQRAFELENYAVTLNRYNRYTWEFGQSTELFYFSSDLYFRPITANLFDLKSKILQGLDRLADAEDAARSALALSRTEPGAHIQLATILRQAGRNGEADTEFSSAVAVAECEAFAPILRPVSPRARERTRLSRAKNLAWALVRAEKRNAAIDVLRDALATSPGSDIISEPLASILVDRGAADEAVRLLSAALDRWPRKMSIRLSLSNILRKTDPRRAIELAQEAADLEPDHPGAQVQLINLLVDADRFADAESAL